MFNDTDTSFILGEEKVLYMDLKKIVMRVQNSSCQIKKETIFYLMKHLICGTLVCVFNNT